jgi:cytidine deaminase
MEVDKRNGPKPCGACLQYIHDFAMNSKTEIITARGEDQKILIETVDVKTIGELLPFPYKK